ncbi:MAG: gluconate 2-dehydrogenase subunit 3 family protein [Alphaproteobacteria bacterium]|nr:gluconate 2-dehydrogenase subunit 3 family protein [Alphaproteobacteria bacterium]
MRTRYPGYNVLDKYHTVSWNDASRRAVDKRLHQVPPRRFFTEDEWQTLSAICDRIVPQAPGPLAPVPIPAFIDAKMHDNETDGAQDASMPSMQECWRRGLRAIDDEARLRFGAAFRELSAGRQETVLALVQTGDLRSPEWEGMPGEKFFKSRLLHDIVTYYYGHPAGWNEIGFGGPASPRGYVRMGFNRRDPWEAEEVRRD